MPSLPVWAGLVSLLAHATAFLVMPGWGSSREVPSQAAPVRLAARLQAPPEATPRSEALRAEAPVVPREAHSRRAGHVQPHTKAPVLVEASVASSPEIITAHRDAAPIRPILQPGPETAAAPVVAEHVHGVPGTAATATGRTGPAQETLAMAATRAESTHHSDVAYLHNPKPAYPAMARRLGLEGTVTLRILVGPEGGPEQSKVVATSGVEALDAAALEAVQRWRFVPAREGRKPIAHWVDVPITFKLAER